MEMFPFDMPAIKRLILLVILFSQGVLAESTDRYEELTGEEDDFDVVEKPWQEQRGEVPPLPGKDQWLPVRLDTLPKDQHAFIDLDTLTIGARDQVVRYWLSIRSSGGGSMTTYEGVHCGNMEFIVYAYGYSDRKPSLRPVRTPKWKKIAAQRSAPYRWELAQDVLCSGEVPRTLRQIDQAAKGRFEKMNPFDNWTNDD